MVDGVGYHFDQSIQKIRVCCGSLQAGSFGPLSTPLHEDIHEIQKGINHFATLLENILRCAKHQITDGAIHDLYNPLNVVIGFAEIVLDAQQLNTVQRIYTRIIHQTGLELVNALDVTFRHRKIRGV